VAADDTEEQTEAVAAKHDGTLRADARSIFNTVASQLRAAREAHAAGARDHSSDDATDAGDADLQNEEYPLIERSVAFPLIRGLHELRHAATALDAGAAGEAIAREAAWLTEEARVVIAADAARSEALRRFLASLSHLISHLEDELVAVDLHIQGTMINDLRGQANAVSEEP
jgi:hypothetical protein